MKTKTTPWLNDAERKIAEAVDDGRDKGEQGYFAGTMAGARIEVEGPAYVVAAITGAIYAALKDF